MPENLKTDGRLSYGVRCITHTYGHHAIASGYGRLAEYMGTTWRPGKSSSLLGDTILRLPAKLVSQSCGLYEYSRHSFTAELGISIDSLANGHMIWHHLYGEKTFLWSSRVTRLRGGRQVASFHHHPRKFPLMLSRTDHLRRLDHAVVMSSEQMELIEGLVGADKVSVVPHGIDTDYWRPVEKSPDNLRRLVFAGTHMRDFETLCELAPRILAARRNVEIVILSSDLQCAPVSQLKGVRWMCGVSDDDYLHQMASADILLQPLLFSTAVNSVLEALSCGVPVITNRGGISDYLDDSCSIQLPVRDVDGMLDATIALLDDADLRQKMGSAARERARLYAWPVIAGQMFRLYQSLECD